MKKGLSILFYILVCSVAASAVHPSIYYIRQSVSDMLLDSRMDYETILKMPDGVVHKANGVMAFKGNNFYDSSNTRFILQNDFWYIGADHLEKTIKVINMGAWKKEYGSLGSLSHFDFLLDADSTVLDRIKISMKELPDHNKSIEMIFSGEESMIKKLVFKFNPSLKIPMEYSGEIAYPVEYKIQKNKKSGIEEEVPAKYAFLSFSCRQITRSNIALFDHRRIIAREKDKEVLIRYRNYETLFTKKIKK